MKNLAAFAESIDLGPGKFGQPNSQFVLSQPEWYSVQAFVAAAKQLPTTLTAFGANLPSAPTGGLDQYQELVNAYLKLKNSCDNFDKEILPDSVKCAVNMISYNIKVQVFYDGFKEEFKRLKKLESAAELEDAVDNITSICAALNKDAKKYEAHAKRVHDNLVSFSEVTINNKTDISNLYTKFNSKLNDKDGSIKKLTDQLEKDKREMKEAEEEYEHDVIVASTSCTYAFAFPIGTIAAGIVAGIYGDKAIKAKAKIAAYKSLIEEMENTKASDTRIALDLTRVTSDLNAVDTKIAAALPCLGKILGLWAGITQVLEALSTFASENIDDMPAVVAKLSMEEAKLKWQLVSDQATGYQMNAYIKVTSDIEAAEIAGHNLKAKLRIVHNANA